MKGAINGKEPTNSNVFEDKKIEAFKIKKEILSLGYDPNSPFIKRIMEKLDKQTLPLINKEYMDLMKELENYKWISSHQDNYPNEGYIVDGGNVDPFHQPAGVSLNEDTIQKLIKKEVENLINKENDKTKSLEEIKNALNAVNPYFNDTKKIYMKIVSLLRKKRINK